MCNKISNFVKSTALVWLGLGVTLFGVASMTLASSLVLASAQKSVPEATEILVDPTRPPHIKPATGEQGNVASPTWVLTSTLIAPDRRLARINGRMVAVGKRINGAIVESIDARGVWLKNAQKRFRIKLLPVKIKEISQPADK